MRFPLFIAKRYLFSRKNTHAINIISGIAVTVFTIGTAVMIIILSFLNGLENLVKDLNNSFDPQLKITAKYNKDFDPSPYQKALLQMPQLRIVSHTLEDNVVVRYGDAQEIARVKGVDNQFHHLSHIDSLVISGSFDLVDGDKQKAVFGGAIASGLNINPENVLKPATLFVPTKGVEYNQLNPEASLNAEYVMPTGVIMLTEEVDKDLILVSLETARALLQRKNTVSAIEISVHNEAELNEVQGQLQKLMGAQFLVQNREQQNESAYRVFKTEKWATFAILTLVLLIAAFNTIGALTMLVLEKSKDIKVLESLGANQRTIQHIFLIEGILITIIGILIGLSLGTAFVWAQQKYGLIRLEGSFVEFFPIALNLTDMVVISLIILALGFLASIYPALKAVRNPYLNYNH